jgi:hypothetical protein
LYASGNEPTDGVAGTQEVFDGTEVANERFFLITAYHAHLLEIEIRCFVRGEEDVMVVSIWRTAIPEQGDHRVKA